MRGERKQRGSGTMIRSGLPVHVHELSQQQREKLFEQPSAVHPIFCNSVVAQKSNPELCSRKQIRINFRIWLARKVHAINSRCRSDLA